MTVKELLDALADKDPEDDVLFYYGGSDRIFIPIEVGQRWYDPYGLGGDDSFSKEETEEHEESVVVLMA